MKHEATRLAKYIAGATSCTGVPRLLLLVGVPLVYHLPRHQVHIRYWLRLPNTGQVQAKMQAPKLLRISKSHPVSIGNSIFSYFNRIHIGGAKKSSAATGSNHPTSWSIPWRTSIYLAQAYASTGYSHPNRRSNCPGWNRNCIGSNRRAECWAHR